MQVASPTDVPPNFITCNGFVIAFPFRIILNHSVAVLQAAREVGPVCLAVSTAELRRSRKSVYHVRMTKVAFEGILFDLDGVLVDSTPAVARVWTWWAKQHGFDPEETVRQAHGRPSISTIRELLPNADHAKEDREVERREIEDVEGVIPLPGALELLQSLPLDRWAIVTSCTNKLAHVRIRAPGLPEPRFIVTASDIKK